MIKKVTAYQTSDGSLFVLELDANRHESLLNAGFHRQIYSFQPGYELVNTKYIGKSTYILDDYLK